MDPRGGSAIRRRGRGWRAGRDGDQEEKTTNLFTPFDGSTLVQKEIYTVPYMTDWIWMSATPSDENAAVVRKVTVIGTPSGSGWPCRKKSSVIPSPIRERKGRVRPAAQAV